MCLLHEAKGFPASFHKVQGVLGCFSVGCFRRFQKPCKGVTTSFVGVSNGVYGVFRIISRGYGDSKGRGGLRGH